MSALFVAGTEGYTAYRIPAVLTLPGGRVLAFCEGRRQSLDDAGDIDLICRASEDGGTHFGEICVIASGHGDTIGNPSPVFDETTGRVHLLMTGNPASDDEQRIFLGQGTRHVYHCWSDDHGAHWSERRDITEQVMLPGWTWYATGPCHMVQLASGRLVVSCNHGLRLTEDGARRMYIAHAIFSDDHGETWQIGADVGPDTNESTVALLADGRLCINMRSYAGKGCRAQAFSVDGGAHWSPIELVSALPDPVCQGSLLACGNTILFSNAADAKRRRRLTIHQSVDGGTSWTVARVITEGAAAYSDLTCLPDGRIGVLFETGNESPYERIEWERVEI